MAYVITEPCINTKDTACVNVCPVDGIHPTKSEGDYAKVAQLYIDPDACIDCGACVPECPVSAIFPESDVQDQSFIAKNRDFYKQSAAAFESQYGSAGRSA
jgi:NAD-dependent dihydropyrimidine dehydrogenase PreA subunit